jgi:hypothetical protein
MARHEVRRFRPQASVPENLLTASPVGIFSVYPAALQGSPKHANFVQFKFPGPRRCFLERLPGFEGRPAVGVGANMPRMLREH